MNENIILLCQVGSQAYGVANENSDEDRMGVYVETRRQVMGLTPHNHVVAQGSDRDEDQVLYSLRKWAHLASKGNPTVLELLYAPEIDSVRCGRILRDNADLFISRAAAGAYLGYAQQQRQRLNGVRGQMNVKRVELVERFGFDTKYASQILRLLHQGIELMETGRLSFPMDQLPREEVLAVKRGDWSLERVDERAAYLEAQLKSARENADLPKMANLDGINALLVELHEETWYLDPVKPHRSA